MATSTITISSSGVATSTTQLSTTSPNTVARTTLLVCITVAAFVCNLVLLVTLLLSATLRNLKVNKHIISLATTNIAVCILGMPMVIGYSVTRSWDYGDILCSLLNHLILTLSIAMCLGITVLNIDRLIAVHGPSEYDRRMKDSITNLIIACYWVLAFIFPLPFSIRILSSAPYQNRYICSIGEGTSLSYLVALYIVCFGLPSFANILIFFFIARKAISEREASLDSSSNQALWQEVKAVGFVLMLYILWIIFETPYLALSSVEQYHNSSPDSQPFTYPADLETAFVWLKFTNSLILPFAVFLWRKDIWIKFKDLILCRKSNTILDASPRAEKNTNPKTTMRQTSNPNSAKFEARFKIPTLRATKDGLHVQDNVELSDDSSFYADMDMTGKSADLEYVPLEVIDDGGIIVKDDTSDYDTDPLSQSDPISSKSARQTPQHRREMSHDESRTNFRQKTSSMSADSGNGSAQSSVGKQKRRKNKRTEESSTVSNTGVIASAESSYELVSESNANNEKSEGLKKTKKHQTMPVSEVDQSDKVEPFTQSDSDSVHNSEEAYLHHNSMQDNQQIVTEKVHDVTDSDTTSTKRKKKKKKQKVEMNDVSTNTSNAKTNSQDFQIETKRCPPRLEPLDPEVFSERRATSNKKKKRRNKTEETEESRHQSSERVSAAVSSSHTIVDEEDSNTKDKSVSKSRKKKKHRSRKVSGESMNPEIKSTLNLPYQETQM